MITEQGRKLQQFYIRKINSSRLRKNGYILPEESIAISRQNCELVAMGESQLIRSIFRIRGLDDDLTKVTEQVHELSKSKSSRRKNQQEIDKLLYIPELVSVVVDKKSDYKFIGQNGFKIGDTHFVRLLCGAGHARRNSAIFVDDKIAQQLVDILNNDYDKEYKIAPSKYNAYFALASSATYQVSEPEFAVIKDAEIERDNCLVEFIEENQDGESYRSDEIVTKRMTLTFNLFDGQGLISPAKAKQWAEELGLDYVPSTFIVRNNFLKGMVVVFDFHKFAEENNKKYFMDVWGNKVDVRNVDMILTESQLKLWGAFKSHAEYVDNCRKNHLYWGVSRFSPREDKDYVFSNYQFLQVEDFTKEEIGELCKPTIDFLEQAIGSDPDITKLYLMGKLADKPYDSDDNIIERISDPITKALLLDDRLLEDPHIKNHIISLLDKRIKESYIGNLLLDGNYQTIIADPYAFCEHVFGMEIKGLLGENQHYSAYWNNRNIDTVAAMRAPLTWRSEVNILHLQNNEKLNQWYSHIYSGIIYNVHGYDNMLQADSDYDGDIIMTTSNRLLIKNAKGGLPITYIKNKTPKEAINPDTLYEYDLKAFDSKIGFITNCSTTMYAMLPQYEGQKAQTDELIKRLKICRKEQGNQIDKAKGLIIKPFPKWWTGWIRTTADNAHLADEIELSNSIIIEKRPYFMRYLYSDYNRRYMEYRRKFDRICWERFGKDFDELTEEDKADDILEKYNKYAPLIDSNCTMNNICHFMESHIKEIKLKYPLEIKEENLMMLKDSTIPFDINKYKKMEVLYRKYKSEKNKITRAAAKPGSIQGEIIYKTIEQYNKAIRNEAFAISDNLAELTNYAIALCYELHPSDNKAFAWSVFGTGIVENIKNNLLRKGIKTYKILCPKIGDVDAGTKVISYMGKEYVEKELDIPTEDEDYDENFDLDQWDLDNNGYNF